MQPELSFHEPTILNFTLYGQTVDPGHRGRALGSGQRDLAVTVPAEVDVCRDGRGGLHVNAVQAGVARPSREGGQCQLVYLV